MNVISIVFAQAWVERLGWTLVHFLWEGAAMAALYAAMRESAKHCAPHCRHWIACAALATMLAAPIVTYGLLGPAQPGARMPEPSGAALASPASGIRFGVTASENVSMSEFAAIWPQRGLRWVVALWLGGALVFWVRLAGGWMAAGRLRKRYACTAPGEWQQILDRLSARLRIGRPVRLLVSGLVEAPVAVGWLRPVVLVPIGALVRVPAEHLEALIIHELAHIRRHDYLINVMQNMTEALLFYHPAVWWISGHIRAERELCCDDVAVAATGDAFTYALALAGMEASRPAHARCALAANGGRLAHRIARLLGETRRDSQRFSAPGAAGAVLLALTAWAIAVHAADRPAFEVASVKPTAGIRSSAGLRPLPGGRLTAQNFSVRNLIAKAYDLRDFQIAGGPNWLHDTGFDIEAKGLPNSDRHELMLMLQSLLEDRFQLRYHRETREVPVYMLTAARGGSKLPAPKAGGCVKADGSVAIAPSDTPCGRINVGMNASGMNLHGGDVPMQEFVRVLASLVGRPVIDRTGVPGNFDVRMEFTVDDNLAGFMGEWGTVQGHTESLMAAAAAADDARGAPNVLRALQEQLGLKLEAGKGPGEVMVIDHVEKPNAN